VNTRRELAAPRYAPNNYSVFSHAGTGGGESEALICFWAEGELHRLSARSSRRRTWLDIFYGKDRATLGIGAANHDPAEFPNPEQLDFAEPKVNSLAFGYGTHFRAS
jgi:hypothetical protein